MFGITFEKHSRLSAGAQGVCKAVSAQLPHGSRTRYF